MKIVRNIQEIKPERPNGLIIVYLLGYGGSIWHSRRHLNLLKNEGYTLLAMDFRDVLKNRDPQDLLTVMDEVDEVLQEHRLIAPNTLIVGVSMGGLIGFNMLKRHKALNKLLIITGGNMALIPKSYKQKWPVSYTELEKIWEGVNIYTPLGTVKDKFITMVLPSRDKMIDPNQVADELDRLAVYNSVKVIRPKGGHFRTIITETMLRPKKSLHLITELANKSKTPLEPTLAENLAQAEAIKAEMTELLRQLETKVTGKSIAKPGGWRHHPQEWAATNPTEKTR